MMRFQSVIIAFVALTASMVVAENNPDESKALEKIELLGGKVTRNETRPDCPVVRVTFTQRSKHFSGKFLHLLKTFKELNTLNFDGANVSDADLNELKELKTLRVLNLGGTEISDDSVDGISQLKNLAELWINETRISEAGCQKLKNSLPNTQVYREPPDESQAIKNIEHLGGHIKRNELRPGRPVIEVAFPGFLDIGPKTRIEDVLSVLKQLPMSD